MPYQSANNNNKLLGEFRRTQDQLKQLQDELRGYIRDLDRLEEKKKRSEKELANITAATEDVERKKTLVDHKIQETMTSLQQIERAINELKRGIA